MVTRVKPTEKYKEYEDKIRALDAYISAQLENKLEYLQPIASNDRLQTNRKTVITQCFIMHDWAAEVRVYRIAEHADRSGQKYHHHLGFLPDAIAEMVKASQYLDEEGRVTYFAQIKQLEDLRIERFDEEGRRRL